MKSKIYLFKDKKDYVKKLTDDNVINIIGVKGSGKTTFVNNYINNDDYIVINCDSLLELPTDNTEEDKELANIRKLLTKKYGEIKENKDFIKYYNEILLYASKKNKKVLIEGNLLQNISPITKLKGIIIIKRTGIIKCFIRTIKRDYPNKYFLNQEIEKHGKILGKCYRLKNIINRRKSIFKEYHDIEKIINELEN